MRGRWTLPKGDKNILGARTVLRSAIIVIFVFVFMLVSGPGPGVMSLSPEEKQVLAAAAGNQPSASNKTLTTAADVVTAANALTIEESIFVSDITKTVKAESRSPEGAKEAFLDELKDLKDRILAHGIRYDWNHPAKSYESAINGNHQVNCAAYVSWALQEMGYLPAGKTFYISDTLHGKAASIIKNSDRFTVKYDVGRVSSVELKPGDIVGWKTHTCVYAGKDSNGNRLWYTAGGKDVRSKNLGPRTKGYDNKYITVLIRLSD